MTEGTSSSSSSYGIGFCGVLTLIFVVFKLLGYITWSWWLVFLPIIIPAGIVLLFWLVIIIFAIVSN